MGKSWDGSVLIGLGVVLLLMAGGVVGYARFAEWQYTSRAGPGPREVLPAQVGLAPNQRGAAFGPTVAVTPVQTPPPGPETTLPPLGSRTWVERVPPSVRATATPRRVLVPSRIQATATPVPPPAQATESVAPLRPDASRTTWVTIPKLGVSVTVSEVGVEDGLYVVPLWDVGHHEDSPNPGAPGNAVLNGHLETIRAGRVFSNLKELAAGDAIYTYTDTQRLTWAVRETATFPNTDRGFIGPTPDRRLTLYTCTGTFNPITRDYSDRLVVVAELAQVDLVTR